MFAGAAVHASPDAGEAISTRQLDAAAMGRLVHGDDDRAGQDDHDEAPDDDHRASAGS